MKEYREHPRGAAIEVDPFAEMEALPYLSQYEKDYCRLYLKYGADAQRAAEEIYINQRNPRHYGVKLLQSPKIQQYLEFLREDILEIKDAEGQAKYSIGARVKELDRLIENSESCNNYQAAANFQTLKENLIGKRRKHSLNLAKCKNDDDRRQALFDAVASGELEGEEFKTLIKALQDRQDMQLNVSGFRAEIPDNGRVPDDN